MFNAERPPIVVLTSNRTRDVHDALKRRCLYHWVEHPDFEREVAIVRLRVPDVTDAARPPGGRRGRGDARAQPVQAAGRRRDDRLGAGARPARRRPSSTRRVVAATLGTVLKYREDQRAGRQHGIADIVKQAFEQAFEQGLAHGVSGVRWRRCAATRPTWPSRSPGCCAALGLRRADRVARHAFVEALGAVGLDRPRRRVLGRAGDAGPPPGGHRRPSTGRSPCSGSDAPADGGSGRARADPAITLAVDTDDDSADDDDDASRQASDDDPTIELRFSRRRGAAPQGLRRLRRRRAGLRPAADGRAAARRARRGVAAAAQPTRRRRAAPTCARTVRAALRAGGEPIRRHCREPGDRAAPARAAARRQRLDGAVRPGAAALRAGRRRRPPAGRGVRPRHPADPGHPRAQRAATPTSRCAGRRHAGQRLERRDPARRLPAHVQRRVGRARHGPRRDRRDPVATGGTAATPRCSPSRCSACSGSPTR